MTVGILNLEFKTIYVFAAYVSFLTKGNNCAVDS